MEEYKVVFVNLINLYENYTDELRDEINAYVDNGDAVIMGLSYYWIKEKFDKFELTTIKKWLEDKGIKYEQMLINYHVQTMYVEEPEWGFKADIYIPAK